jgi:hypothetical protein
MLRSPEDSGLPIIVKGTVLVMTYDFEKHQYDETERRYYLSRTDRLMFDHPIGLSGMRRVQEGQFVYRHSKKGHTAEAVIVYPDNNLNEHKLRFHKQIVKTLKRLHKKKLIAQQDLRISSDERFIGQFALSSPLIHLTAHRVEFVHQLKLLCSRFGLVVSHWEVAKPGGKKS